MNIIFGLPPTTRHVSIMSSPSSIGPSIVPFNWRPHLFRTNGCSGGTARIQKKISGYKFWILSFAGHIEITSLSGSHHGCINYISRCFIYCIVSGIGYNIFILLTTRNYCIKDWIVQITISKYMENICAMLLFSLGIYETTSKAS